METLAINGGPRAVTLDQREAVEWPTVGEEEIEAVRRVLTEPGYAFYEEAYRLEEEFAAHLGVPHALAHCNGTSALFAALFAVGIQPGDEVIVPSYTFLSTCVTVAALLGIPVFADINERSLNIDPDDVERRITAHTRAIVVVHVWGVPCEMDRIMAIAARHGLKVIEDAAHAHGAEYHGRKAGDIGDIGCFSFQASKLLPAIEGGILVTRARGYYERAMALGHYERLGKLPAESPYRKYALTAMGYKFRIHPAAAAMARVRLRHFDEVNGQRNRNMDYLDKELGAVPGFLATEVPADSRRSYYGYRLRYDPDAMGGAGRPSVMAALQAEGVQVSGWDFPLQHQQPFYREARQQVAKLVGRDIPDAEVRLPVTEQVLERLLSLPTFPRGTQELLDQYVHAFRKVSAGWREIPPFEERQREPVDRSLRTIR